MQEPKKPSIKSMRCYKSKSDVVLISDKDLNVHRLIKFPNNGVGRGEFLDEFKDLEKAKFMKFMCSAVSLYLDDRN